MQREKTIRLFSNSSFLTGVPCLRIVFPHGRGTSRILIHVGIADWRKPLRESILLQILPMNAGPVTVEHIALDPAKCNGATFRYSPNGWGLVQLHLEAERGDKMRASNSNHNSEKRALAWASTYPDMPGPSAWDWVHVVSFSNRLNRVIRKLGVEKAGSRTILPKAAELKTAQSIKFV